MRRSSLVLCAALQLCRARQHSFSIHDDLLAYPQFEVVFSDTYISELDAQALIQNAHPPHPSYTADFASATDLTDRIRASDAADSISPASPATSSSSAHHGAPDGPAAKGDDGSARISETYEILRMGSDSRYLCTIPVLAPPEALNSTATELAKAEEARELIRASERGWELMSGLDGACLYYVSGWWSYSFCYGREILQFHALPNAVGKAGTPVRDPDTQEYTLGKMFPPEAASAQQQRQPPKQLAGHEEQKAGGPAEAAAGGGGNGLPPSTTTASPLTPPNTEVAIKDDQRYLVQRLDGGTICDLTGRERTIEVQYHCNPNANNDRIGWIKEITTCSYLMVVNTPRLCEDVAFLPPKESRAHPISCRAIVSTDEEAEAWHHRKTLEAFEAMGVMGANPIGGERAARQPLPGQSQHHGMTIGGVVVGGRQVLALKENGEPVARLPVPRGYVSGQKPGSPLVEVLATAKSKAEGGEVVMLTDEELQKMSLDPKIVEELYKQLQQYAGDKGWKLEVVEVPGQVAEIRGVIDPDSPDDEDEDYYDEDEERVERGGKRSGDKGNDGYTNSKKYRRKDPDGDDAGEGSEEKFFKEEL